MNNKLTKEEVNLYRFGLSYEPNLGCKVSRYRKIFVDEVALRALLLTVLKEKDNKTPEEIADRISMFILKELEYCEIE